MEGEKLVPRWSALVADGLLGWRERRQALRELKDLQRLDEMVLKHDEGNLVSRAKAALEAGDSVAALQFWRRALERYPTFAKTAHDSLEVLLGLKHFDEAEALMRENQRRAPGDVFYASGYALTAERRGDTEEAINRWGQVRKRFPGSWQGYVNGATCLGRAGQHEAAEALSRRAIKLFPNEAVVWISSAQSAERRRDWPTTIRRWEIVRDRHGHITGDIGVARGLEELGRIEEAEALLKEAQSRRSSVPEIAVGLVRLADLRGNTEEAVQRCADARRRFPLLSFGYREGFRHLAKMARYEDAEVILLAALERFPKEAWPAVEYASLAQSRGDWKAAATRWAAVRVAWPDRQDGYLGGAAASAALGRQDEAAELKAEHHLRFAR